MKTELCGIFFFQFRPIKNAGLKYIQLTLIVTAFQIHLSEVWQLLCAGCLRSIFPVESSMSG